jgi:hypothetical protein
MGRILRAGNGMETPFFALLEEDRLSPLAKAARRRAVVRRSGRRVAALYACHIRERSDRRTKPNQIAVPGGGPSMRGGLWP